MVSKRNLSSTEYNISEGRLEVYRHHQWGTVCSRHYFGQLEANTACKQLGFIKNRNFGTVLDLGFPMGSTDVTIWLHNMACQLNDSRLLECEQDGEVMCRHLDDAAVSCLGEGVVRTVTESGTPLFAARGRLEIFYGGQWATICYDNGFGLREAHTACQQLGYLGATYVSAITDLRPHPQASYETPMYKLECSSLVQSSPLSSLSLCIFWMQTSCAHNCDTGISCYLGASPTFQTENHEACYHGSEGGVLVTSPTLATSASRTNSTAITSGASSIPASNVEKTLPATTSIDATVLATSSDAKTTMLTTVNSSSTLSLYTIGTFPINSTMGKLSTT